MIINRSEAYICQINFYSGQETLLQVGEVDDVVKNHGGRVEVFEIAADEQLIGAELYHGELDNNGNDYFRGVTWLKCKIAKWRLRLKNNILLKN